jgi:hypothetical protein
MDSITATATAAIAATIDKILEVLTVHFDDPDDDSFKKQLLFMLVVCLFLRPYTTSCLLSSYAILIHWNWIYYPGEEPEEFAMQFFAALVFSRVLGQQVSNWLMIWNLSLLGLFKNFTLTPIRGMTWIVLTAFGVVVRAAGSFFGSPEDDEDEGDDNAYDTVVAAPTAALPVADEKKIDAVTLDEDTECKDAVYSLSLLLDEVLEDDVSEDSDYSYESESDASDATDDESNSDLVDENTAVAYWDINTAMFCYALLEEAETE